MKYYFRLMIAVLCTLAPLLSTSCSVVTGSDATGSDWAIKGTWTDSCCCKVACPCLFGSKPTEGFCQGASLLEIDRGHYGDVSLDGTTAVVAYHVKQWTMIYAGETASAEQREALSAVVPKALPFLGPIESVEPASLVVKRSDDRVMYSAGGTSVELELLEGADGQPIKLHNLPAAGTPFPKFHDHTQYKSVRLEHDSKDHDFSWSGRNGFVAKFDLSGS